MPVTFGPTAANPKTAEETASIARFAAEASAPIDSIEIWRVNNAFNHTDGILRMFAAANAFTVLAILQIDGRIAQHVAATTSPTAEDVIAFLESDAGSNFTWLHADAALVADKNRVAGRLIGLFNNLLAIARRPNSGDVDDDRVSLLPSQNESCTAANRRLYGYSPNPSGLAIMSVLGKMFKGFSTGTIAVLSLDKMIAQNEHAPNERFHFDVSTNTFAKKRAGAKVHGMTDFFYRLSLRSNGLAYVGCVFVADSATWTGCGDAAKLGASYFQFTRRDAERYAEMWRPYASKFESHADMAMRLDYKIQKLIPDMFAERVRYGHALVEAFNVLRGEIASFQPRQLPPKRSFPPPGDPREKRDLDRAIVGTAFEVAKKSRSFDSNLRTAQKNEAGELLCKPFNDRRDGDCKFGANCRFKHQCDVLVNGKACGSTEHHRLTHP